MNPIVITNRWYDNNMHKYSPKKLKRYGLPTIYRHVDGYVIQNWGEKCATIHFNERFIRQTRNMMGIKASVYQVLRCMKPRPESQKMESMYIVFSCFFKQKHKWAIDVRHDAWEAAHWATIYRTIVSDYEVMCKQRSRIVWDIICLNYQDYLPRYLPAEICEKIKQFI